MKIMYYELIKMLIDYERGERPDSWEASKTVTKIEGYQVVIEAFPSILHNTVWCGSFPFC
jgi:hypothetical protein